MKTVKILSGNRISLPNEFMEFWKLKEGDLVGLSEIEEKVVVIPVEVKPKK